MTEPTNSVTEEEVTRMLEDQLEDGIKRAYRWLYFGAAIALINIVIAGYVWMVKP